MTKGRASVSEGRQAPPIVYDVLRSSGQELDSTSRSLLEPRFGHDFSRVRVHADARAAESAEAVGANAYTVGRHVVFGAGQYAPGSRTGQRLLAHELAHVTQQAAATETPGQIKVAGTNDASEHEAGSAARSALREHRRVPLHHHVPITLQRDSFGRDDDPIHQPIIESYRKQHGLPSSGLDEFGQPIGPSAAEIKYGRTPKTAAVQVPPPASQKLSETQAANLANQPLPPNVAVSTGTPGSGTAAGKTGAAPTPAPASEPEKREPIQFGLDFSVDTTLAKQASILPRHFDFYRISLGGVPIDLGHEPTGSAGLSFNPKSFGTLTALASISAVNIHIQRQGKDFIELALGQLGIGYDSNKNTFVPLSAQAEIHSPNEHFSIYVNGGGTWSRAPGQGWTATWNPLTLGILFHALNP
jgi:hypothetical protein